MYFPSILGLLAHLLAVDVRKTSGGLRWAEAAGAAEAREEH